MPVLPVTSPSAPTKPWYRSKGVIGAVGAFASAFLGLGAVLWGWDTATVSAIAGMVTALLALWGRLAAVDPIAMPARKPPAGKADLTTVGIVLIIAGTLVAVGILSSCNPAQLQRIEKSGWTVVAEVAPSGVTTAACLITCAVAPSDGCVSGCLEGFGADVRDAFVDEATALLPDLAAAARDRRVFVRGPSPVMAMGAPSKPATLSEALGLVITRTRTE